MNYQRETGPLGEEYPHDSMSIVEENATSSRAIPIHCCNYWISVGSMRGKASGTIFRTSLAEIGFNGKSLSLKY